MSKDLGYTRLLGNVYGSQFGTGYAGNVWDKDYYCPTLRTMQGGGKSANGFIKG
jgi:hypothetical protein